MVSMQQPTPVMSQEEFNSLLGHFHASDPSVPAARAGAVSIMPKGLSDQNGLWVNVAIPTREGFYAAAGLSLREMRVRGVCHRYYVELVPALKAALERTMIYGAPATGQQYYLELYAIPETGEYRLYAKYQQILGSRLLALVDQAFVDNVTSQIAGELREQIPSLMRLKTYGESPKATSVGPKTEQEEVELLLLDGDVIKLPTEQLLHYAKLKARIEKAGGSYNSRGHFDFPAGISAAEVLEAMKGGKKINSKKDSQFFRTPQALAEVVCRAAGLDASRPVLEPSPRRLRVLEPSAGDGALSDIARAAGADVVVVENWAPNVLALKGKGYDVIDRSFLDCTPAELGMFDVIVANPPFTRGMDIRHVEHMFSFLVPGGKLSVLMSTSWIGGSQRTQALFQDFLEQHGATIERIPAGTFKESGTNVATAHVVFTKPQPKPKAPPVAAPKAEVGQLALI